MQRIEENPWRVVQDPSQTEEQREAIFNYINEVNARAGIYKAYSENIERKREGIKKWVEVRTHKETGTLIAVETKDGKIVFVVGGELKVLDD